MMSAMGAKSCAWMKVILALVMVQELANAPGSCKAIRNEGQTGDAESANCSATSPVGEGGPLQADDEDDEGDNIDFSRMDLSQLPDAEIEGFTENEQSANKLLVALLLKFIVLVKELPIVPIKISKLLNKKIDGKDAPWAKTKFDFSALADNSEVTIGQIMQWSLDDRRALARRLVKVLAELRERQRKQGEKDVGKDMENMENMVDMGNEFHALPLAA
eukprot:TRINITY_DN46421_c0_g1_i1.p1 TRINITY_DN46421_c0_g1~~TRINITY_DN46421_c0_g1_i1.p1  ORF type:complete len:218 (+),score=49.79 TRINITY_DN46421_c0_g1_i1:65-718(+)